MSAARHRLSLAKLRSIVGQYDAGHLKVCEHMLYIMLGDFQGTPEAHRAWALMALAMTMSRLGYDGVHINGLWREGKEAYRKLCENYHSGQDESHDRDMERLRLLVVNAEPMLAEMGLVMESSELCLGMKGLNISSETGMKAAGDQEVASGSGATGNSTVGNDSSHDQKARELDSNEPRMTPSG